MTDAPFPGGDLREAAEQNGHLVQAINLYRQSIHYLEQSGAPEAAHVWQRLHTAELKQKLEPVFKKQGDFMKDLISRTKSMNEEELATYLEQLAKQLDEEETNKR